MSDQTDVGSRTATLIRDNIPGPVQRADARLVLSSAALRRPDPAAELAEVLDMLDLRSDA